MSLFTNSCCGSEQAGGHKLSGVSELLNQLANANNNLCSLGQQSRVLLVNRGTNTPVDLLGTTTPTEFTLVRFDPKTYTAVFTYADVDGTGAAINRTYVTDSRCICGVVCLGA
ncbi:hypothetical protein [Fictibacillus phosphorivorans]|uniref:hypothetical protein n=1 Tax=Fictibacillus phosphorivorans TaxID=1221500 RepID=UPI002040AB4F|nr:hypothetical protein [Fictibacillus phosphorivorans]MCM3719139.1 hypothetical protein [Fictibacillus phosphorivorans]MCM3776761.1 hypothetical protein [Fictibacillus phosphorivorans]